jgi:hypothetical protein
VNVRDSEAEERVDKGIDKTLQKVYAWKKVVKWFLPWSTISADQSYWLL